MNLFRILVMIGLVGVGIVSGESADTNNSMLDLKQRIEGSKKIFVSLPAITPFDSVPKLRELYLEQYQAGYRNVVAELHLDPDFRFDFKKGVTEPVFKAVTQGWSDGTMKALKDHPEKVKVCPTIYKTDIKGILPASDKGLYIDPSKAGVNVQK